MTADNRQTTRRQVSWRARLLRADGSIVDCRAIDSSAAGVGLVAQESVGVGEHLRIALQVPQEGSGRMEVVVHDGKVAGVVLTPSGYRIGIELVDPLLALVDAIQVTPGAAGRPQNACRIPNERALGLSPATTGATEVVPP